MKVVNKEKVFEIVRYFIVGVLTTVVSLAVYYGLVSTILNPENAISLQIANAISWIVSVLFAYVTNRIFVFKSKNKKRFKEFASFLSSRVITLVLDMGLMFLGVTLLSINDKFVKLFSQGFVIVANYIFSKLFVFKSSHQCKRDFSKIYDCFFKVSIFCVPILFLLMKLFSNQFFQWIFLIFMFFLFLVFSCSLLIRKKNIWFLSFLYGYILLHLLYSYCNQLDVIQEAIFLLQILFLPLSALYFQSRTSLVDASFMTKIFFLMMSLIFVCKETIVGVLILFLPISLEVLRKHHNSIAKVLGLVLITFSIIFLKSNFLFFAFLVSLFYQMWRERKNIKNHYSWFSVCILFLIVSILCIYSKQITFHNEAISSSSSIFFHANLEEQMFGITNLNDLSLPLIGIDIFDIFYHIGFVGIFFYFCFMVYMFFHIRIFSYQRLGFIIGILFGFITTPIFTSFLSSFFFGVICSKEIPQNKKRILLVSNMYPSIRFKHYGSFVKNTKNLLEDRGFVVDGVFKYKQKTVVGTFISYVLFYIVSFYKSIFYSYDFIYVHFISHSTFPVLLGKYFSKDTKLILNAHGNDVVPDLSIDEKNVNRSKKVLPYADLCIVPSKYFYDVLVKDYHFPTEKIRVFPSSGVSTSVFYPKNKEECLTYLNLDSHVSYFGYVSRLEEGKGYDVVLKAIDKLKREGLFQNKKLLVVGSGSLQGDFDDLVSKYHLGEFIIQVPFVSQEDLVYYYNIMEVLLFPTKRKSESLGLVGLEAMACKIFVIGCNLYGPREYLFHGKTALTYTKDDDLVLQIKEFLKMKESKKIEIISSAYQKALEYDADLLGDKLADIFCKES